MTGETVPLTMSQRTRLVVLCLPFPFFAAAVAFYFTVWVDFASGVTGQTIDPLSSKGLIFSAFMALVLAVTGYGALCALRDLASGVALVMKDRVLRVHSRRGGYRGARLEKLGRVRLLRWTGTPDRLHRIVYSPASKIVWEAAPTKEFGNAQ